VSNTNGDFDSILEQCLAQIDAGKARQVSCLLSYPAQADRLEPLLKAANWVQSISTPALSPQAKDRIEVRLLKTVKVRPRRRAVPRRAPRIRVDRRWTFVGTSAALFCLFLIVAVVSTAAGVLPGSPLYPVKLATENAWLWLAPASDEPEIHLTLAQRRLDETEALDLQGDRDLVALEAVAHNIEAALTTAEELPPSLARPVLEEVVVLTGNQREQLCTMLIGAPPEVQARLETALQTSVEQAERARVLIGSLDPTVPPGQTRTPEPPGQTRTPEPPGQTRTPEPPGLTKTPEPPGATRTPEPPGRTRTPEPPGLTKTPEPPGLTKTPEPPGLTRTPRPTKTPRTH